MAGLRKLKEPNASYRLAVAVRYWHCARLILHSQIRPFEFMEPVGHLLSMSTELALKAHLLVNGYTNKQLGQRRIGHDLGELLQLCVQRGVEISQEDAMDVLTMRTAHSAHFHRYGPGDVTTGYAIGLLDERRALLVVARLIDLVGGDSDFLRKQHQHPDRLEWPETYPPLCPVTSERLRELTAAAEQYARSVEAIATSRKS